MIRRSFLVLAAVLGLAPLAPAPASAAFETRATAAWVYDLTTDTVLLEKDADRPLPPASMSKLMTLYMLFTALKENPALSLDTEFTVSERAQAMGGSTMFLNTRDRPTAEDLIKGIIVQSGNDATVAVAEGLAGTEEAFARLATEKARSLGMLNSSFANASGWPDPRHRMSMHDLGLLATHIIRDFPEYYPFFALTEFSMDDRAPDNRFNRNPLLKLGVGADGLKTGHTAEAGYGLVGSALQGNRRIVFVITGLDSDRARAEEAERIVNWAFRQFVLRRVVEEGTRIAEAPVWMGGAATVGLVADGPVDLLVPLVGASGTTAEVRFTGPLEAPIVAGAQVAELVVQVPELPPETVPLFAAEDVPRGGFTTRLGVAANRLLGMVLGPADAAPQP